MKISPKVLVGALTVSSLFGFVLPVTALAATAPSLGVADGYSLYGDAGVTNTGAGTHVWGNVGDNSLGHPGLLGSQVDGTIDAGAGVAGVAGTAYGALDAQGATGALDLAGTHTVTPGVYTVGATTLNGTLTLDGAGVYIFRSDSSITTSGAGTVNLINGATACNVFWQVPTSMTIGAGSHVEGTIIAQTGLISLATGATLVGRALAHTQVTLDSNQITEPICGGTPPPPPPPPPSAPTCTLTANPTTVQTGTSSALSWTTTNATSFSIDNSVGVVTPVASGSTSVSPITTTTYTGTATLTGGSSATCSATVEVTAPPASTTATLHVVKIVVNGNGGTAVPSNFSLHVKNAGIDVTGSPAAGAVAPGTSYTLAAGAYVVSEDAATLYTQSFSGDCNSSGSVALSTGDDKTCTITNTYKIVTTVTTTTTTTPKLPNTGLPPQGRTPWDIFITAGILMVVSSSLVLALKKRTV